MTSSAPAAVELTGLSTTTAWPLLSVRAVPMLVLARPRTTVKLTTWPTTGTPPPSTNVAVTVAGDAELMAVDDSAVRKVGGAALASVDTWSTAALVTVTPPTVAVATIWSAPLLDAVFGDTTTVATPTALVTAEVWLKVLRLKLELTATSTPGAGLPAVSSTSTLSVAGLLAVTVLLLGVSVISGWSATTCTARLDCSDCWVTVADAVMVSATVTPAAVGVASTWAMPPASVSTDAAESVTRPAAAANETAALATARPAASRTAAVRVTGPSDVRSVVELALKLITGALPATVNDARPVSVVVSSVTVATISSAPDRPPFKAVRLVCATPSVPVATEVTASAARSPRVITSVTSLPDSGRPLASRTVTATVLPLEGVIVEEPNATVTVAPVPVPPEPPPLVRRGVPASPLPPPPHATSAQVSRPASQFLIVLKLIANSNLPPRGRHAAVLRRGCQRVVARSVTILGVMKISSSVLLLTLALLRNKAPT